jgi:hypothetical protein
MCFVNVYCAYGNKLLVYAHCAVYDKNRHGRQICEISLISHSNFRNKNHCPSYVKVETKEPTLRTRLSHRRRSESLADLRQSLTKEEGINRREFEAMRKSLKEAVFERWYFTKFVEATEARRQREAEAEAKRVEEQERKKEVEERAGEEFRKWLADKRKRAAKADRLAKAKNGVDDGGKRKPEVDSEVVERKNKEWLEAKRKELAKKRTAEDKKSRTKEEEEAVARAKKHEEAGKVYLAWKEGKMRELKERVEREKARLAKDKEDKLEQARSAEAAFAVWKNKKLAKEKEKMVAKAEDEKPAKNKKKELVDENGNKMEDARAAYEAWLEDVEAREEEEAGREEERRRLLMWKPPWYPGGKALYFV